MSALRTLLKPFFEVDPKDLPPLTAKANETAARLRKVVYTVTECCELTLTTPNPNEPLPHSTTTRTNCVVSPMRVPAASWLRWTRSLLRHVLPAATPSIMHCPVDMRPA